MSTSQSKSTKNYLNERMGRDSVAAQFRNTKSRLVTDGSQCFIRGTKGERKNDNTSEIPAGRGGFRAFHALWCS